ncbi:MAG TPA: hydrogenase expression/formation protein HypE [Deltaproteobacteria bacterium]|nr:hydrogenase expression/formation protein HypE [Deltaproteobacteria bacterium]
MSKFSLEVLERCVFPHAVTHDPDVLLGSAFGEDVALTRVGDDILASHVDPIIGAIDNIGWLAVHVACNDIAASGIRPRWILVLVLVPSRKDEDLLESIMADVHRAAVEINVSVVGGHTGYSSGISRPLVAVSAFGDARGRTPVRTGGAKVGDHVMVTKGIALEGTAILACDFADVARDLGITDHELARAKDLILDVSVIREAEVFAEFGASAMHDVTRGGIFETLLEMARTSGVRFRINISLLPQRAVVERFARCFAFDPLRMISSGTLVATVEPGNADAAARRLGEIGILCADIGTVEHGDGVELIDGDKTDHFDEIRCEDDELARMWTLYPR